MASSAKHLGSSAGRGGEHAIHDTLNSRPTGRRDDKSSVVSSHCSRNRVEHGGSALVPSDVEEISEGQEIRSTNEHKAAIVVIAGAVSVLEMQTSIRSSVLHGGKANVLKKDVVSHRFDVATSVSHHGMLGKRRPEAKPGAGLRSFDHPTEGGLGGDDTAPILDWLSLLRLGAAACWWHVAVYWIQPARTGLFIIENPEEGESV